MQTERVTFLTTPDHKAALDAFARERGMSVGHVLREAADRYIRTEDDEAEAALELLLPELEKLLPKWHAQLDSMEESIASARQSIRDALARVEATQ
jgi:hypothetical protein